MEEAAEALSSRQDAHDLEQDFPSLVPAPHVPLQPGRGAAEAVEIAKVEARGCGPSMAERLAESGAQAQDALDAGEDWDLCAKDFPPLPNSKGSGAGIRVAASEWGTERSGVLGREDHLDAVRKALGVSHVKIKIKHRQPPGHPPTHGASDRGGAQQRHGAGCRQSGPTQSGPGAAMTSGDDAFPALPHMTRTQRQDDGFERTASEEVGGDEWSAMKKGPQYAVSVPCFSASRSTLVSDSLQTTSVAFPSLSFFPSFGPHSASASLLFPERQVRKAVQSGAVIEKRASKGRER